MTDSRHSAWVKHPRRARVRRSARARVLDLRLMRNTAVLLAAPLLVLAVTSTAIGPLPAPVLPPAFDTRAAAAAAGELARDHPTRIPGTLAAARAADWYRVRLALYGLGARTDRWRADVPGLGDVELENVVTTVEGEKDDAIIIVAHRDNRGQDAGVNDNASGTAALLELARRYGRAGAPGRRVLPSHTLVFVSTDAGAYGSLGAARFAAASPLAARATAVLSLDALTGAAWPRVEIAAAAKRSPTPALVRTVVVRSAEQLARAPSLPGPLTQLVGLGLPFGYGEQAAFLGQGRSAVRITTAGGSAHESGDGGSSELRRLGQLGRAAEASLASLDAAIQLSGRTAAYVYAGDRVVRGWALAFLLIVAVVPFWVAVADLLVRVVRRGTRLRDDGRGLGRRLAVSAAAGVAVLAAAAADVLPLGGPHPPAADRGSLAGWQIGLVLVLVAAVGVVALRLMRRTQRGGRDVQGGYAVAFAALALIAGAIVLVNPFALVFVLPSIYAWSCLPAIAPRRPWVADVVFGLGFLGPALGLVVLGAELGLGLGTIGYALALGTSGTTPLVLVLCTLAWAAVAAHVASVVAANRPPADQPKRV